jgi:hypothetical protein
LRAAVLVRRLPAPHGSAQRQRRGPEFFLETFDLCLRQRNGFHIFSGAAKLFNFALGAIAFCASDDVNPC